MLISGSGRLAAVTEPVVEVGTTHRGLDLFLPTWPDVLWSAVVLLIIAAVFYRLVLPKFMSVLDQRSEMIAGGLQQAEQVKIAAQETLAQRQEMLEEARAEASDIRAQARRDRDEIVSTAKSAAEQEVRRVEDDSARRLEAQRVETETRLRQDVGTLATQLAAKIVGASLAKDTTKKQSIDRFLDELEASMDVEPGQRQPSAAELVSASALDAPSEVPIVQAVVKDRFHFFKGKHL